MGSAIMVLPIVMAENTGDWQGTLDYIMQNTAFFIFLNFISYSVLKPFHLTSKKNENKILNFIRSFDHEVISLKCYVIERKNRKQNFFYVFLFFLSLLLKIA